MSVKQQGATTMKDLKEELIEALQNHEKEKEFCIKYPTLNVNTDNHLIFVSDGQLKCLTLG
jgi:hypothetical protein